MLNVFIAIENHLAVGFWSQNKERDAPTDNLELPLTLRPSWIQIEYRIMIILHYFFNLKSLFTTLGFVIHDSRYNVWRKKGIICAQIIQRLAENELGHDFGYNQLVGCLWIPHFMIKAFDHLFIRSRAYISLTYIFVLFLINQQYISSVSKIEEEIF